ncbi:uncharacterized protein BXZ73DRAFT_99969 [Epithele typhae]|uniref:uncharacterized protein n=1 Tax=Epithele typhae TaxID=378194 RepID=UPI002007957C|nr:uncharacterized protein BXZ73DRAFT_99969 [Epithele typhae]KAH9938906.1 hypothetical protein BXZ73DRAFT_99969 [Epithele typhae]
MSLEVSSTNVNQATIKYQMRKPSITFLVECDRCFESAEPVGCTGSGTPCVACDARAAVCTLYGVGVDGIIRVNGVGPVAFFDGRSFWLVKDMKDSGRAVAEGVVDFTITHLRKGDWKRCQGPSVECPFDVIPLQFKFSREHARKVAARALFIQGHSKTYGGCREQEFLKLGDGLPRYGINYSDTPSRRIRPCFRPRSSSKRDRSPSPEPTALKTQKLELEETSVASTSSDSSIPIPSSPSAGATPGPVVPDTRTLRSLRLALDQWNVVCELLIASAFAVDNVLSGLHWDDAVYAELDRLQGFNGYDAIRRFFRDRRRLARALRHPLPDGLQVYENNEDDDRELYETVGDQDDELL